jgi:hypothetical protein
LDLAPFEDPEFAGAARQLAIAMGRDDADPAFRHELAQMLGQATEGGLDFYMWRTSLRPGAAGIFDRLRSISFSLQAEAAEATEAAMKVARSVEAEAMAEVAAEAAAVAEGKAAVEEEEAAAAAAAEEEAAAAEVVADPLRSIYLEADGSNRPFAAAAAAAAAKEAAAAVVAAERRQRSGSAAVAAAVAVEAAAAAEVAA